MGPKSMLAINKTSSFCGAELLLDSDHLKMNEAESNLKSLCGKRNILIVASIASFVAISALVSFFILGNSDAELGKI